MLNTELLTTFSALLEEATHSGDREPTAMNLATVDAAGRVSSRMVLLKGVDERGFREATAVPLHRATLGLVGARSTQRNGVPLHVDRRGRVRVGLAEERARE